MHYVTWAFLILLCRVILNNYSSYHLSSISYLLNTPRALIWSSHQLCQESIATRILKIRKWGSDKSNIFFFLFFFIAIQLQLSAFSPLPPLHPSQTHLPPPPPIWFCPCVLYRSSCKPLCQQSPPHSPLAIVRLFLTSMYLVIFCLLFLLSIMFQLRVRSYGICPSLSGLFHLA